MLFAMVMGFGAACFASGWFFAQKVDFEIESRKRLRAIEKRWS